MRQPGRVLRGPWEPSPGTPGAGQVVTAGHAPGTHAPLGAARREDVSAGRLGRSEVGSQHDRGGDSASGVHGDAFRSVQGGRRRPWCAALESICACRSGQLVMFLLGRRVHALGVALGAVERYDKRLAAVRGSRHLLCSNWPRLPPDVLPGPEWSARRPMEEVYDRPSSQWLHFASGFFSVVPSRLPYANPEPPRRVPRLRWLRLRPSFGPGADRSGPATAPGRRAFLPAADFAVAGRDLVEGDEDLAERRYVYHPTSPAG